MEIGVPYLPIYIEGEKVEAIFALLWLGNKDRTMLILL